MHLLGSRRCFWLLRGKNVDFRRDARRAPVACMLCSSLRWTVPSWPNKFWFFNPLGLVQLPGFGLRVVGHGGAKISAVGGPSAHGDCNFPSFSIWVYSSLINRVEAGGSKHQRTLVPQNAGEGYLFGHE